MLSDMLSVFILLLVGLAYGGTGYNSSGTYSSGGTTPDRSGTSTSGSSGNP